MTDNPRTEQPVRVQLRRTKGWKMPPNTVRVARPSPWGNPFKVDARHDAETAVWLYRRNLAGLPCDTHGPSVDQQAAARRFVGANLGRLRGKNLACWCKPGDPCHADVLLEIANAD